MIVFQSFFNLQRPGGFEPRSIRSTLTNMRSNNGDKEVAYESQSETPNSGRQAQHLMETKSGTEGSGDVSFWKNKYKHLQERFTEKMTQVEMKWRLTLKEAEEKKNELENHYLQSKGREKGFFRIFTKANNQAELEETQLKEEMFQRTIGELEENKQKLVLAQKGWDMQTQELVQQICELEEKDEGWKRKVMQLEKENKILAEKVNSWERKVKNVELQTELAEKHERWAARVHELQEEKRQTQTQTRKNKVKEFQKENALNVDEDDGRVQTGVKAQQVKHEELMEKQQSLDRKIKETNDKNSSLAKKVDELERKVKQLEQNFPGWEKKVEGLKENQKQPKREQMKARIKRLIGANRKRGKRWKRKVEATEEKKKKVASIVRTLRRKMKELKIKFELRKKFQRWKKKVEKREEMSQKATLGKDGKNERRNKSSKEGEKITTE